MTEARKKEFDLQQYIEHAETLRRNRKRLNGTELRRVEFSDGIVLEILHKRWVLVAVRGIIEDRANRS